MANALTMFRLLIVPVFIYFLASSPEGHSTVAGWLFLTASASDWLDGQIARRTGTVSEFGTFADPLADRLLIASALVILLAKHALPAPAVMLVLLRDAYVLAGYWVLARRGIRVGVIRLGKIGTALLLVALVLAVFGWSGAGFVFWSGVALSLLSGAAYTRLAVGQFRRPRAGVAETR
jgi:CDP-diacylglycerol---glycerol-3-phosphate 3-phosphatidyltransferase